MESDSFRDSLLTDLGRSIYDWSPIRKPVEQPEIIKEIIAAFCVREGKKCLSFSQTEWEWAVVELDCAESIKIHALWRAAFWEHGYSAPILICKDRNEQDGI